MTRSKRAAAAQLAPPPPARPIQGSRSAASRACQSLAEPLGVLRRPPGDCRFLQRKWTRELDCRLIKEVWAFTGDRIAARFAYEWHGGNGAWFRSHGNEQWEFDADGPMRRREASINDVPIAGADRRFR